MRRTGAPATMPPPHPDPFSPPEAAETCVPPANMLLYKEIFSLTEMQKRVVTKPMAVARKAEEMPGGAGNTASMMRAPTPGALVTGFGPNLTRDSPKLSRAVLINRHAIIPALGAG